MANHNPRAIVLIHTDRRGNVYYPSVAEASRCTGIPRNRMFEALASDSGLVRWTDPPIYIDIAAQFYDVEASEDEEPDDDDE